MKAKFELRAWLSENRETIISSYNKLAQEQLFNGITLKAFMTEIMENLQYNNVKSAARAGKMLPFVMGSIYFNNSTVVADDKRTNALAAKYAGTAYMALV
jgi:hypothetical protein